MVVLQVLDVMTAPVLGMYTGHSGNQAVFSRLNNQFADAAGVLFGSASSMGFSNRYDAFTQKIQEMDGAAVSALNAATAAIFHPDTIVVIDNQEALENIPSCMHIPILTMPKVRDLYDQGLIYGWGVDASKLPDEDVVGRLLDNGTSYFNHPDIPNDRPVGYTFRSDDPVYDFDELSKLRASREWVDNFLEDQLRGDRMDITDIPNRIGKLK